MTKDNISITIGQSHRIDRAQDDARVLQGQVNMQNPTSAKGGSNGITGGGDHPDLRDRPPSSSDPVSGEPSNNDSEDEVTSRLHSRLAHAEDAAVTFQVEIEQRGRTKTEKPLRPSKEHYNNTPQHNFECGDIYRLWHDTNTDVHLRTYVIIGKAGTTMTCLKVVRCNTGCQDHRFERAHGKIKVEFDTPGSYKRTSSRLRSRNGDKPVDFDDDDDESFVVVMPEKQRMVNDCWIDLRNPWNIDWQSEYHFVYCGVLKDESLMRVRSIHQEMYLRSLQAP